MSASKFFELWDNVSDISMFSWNIGWAFLYFLEWISVAGEKPDVVFFNIQTKTSEIYLHYIYSIGSSWLAEVPELPVSATGGAEGLGGGVISSAIPLEFGPLLTAPGKGAFFSS